LHGQNPRRGHEIRACDPRRPLTLAHCVAARSPVCIHPSSALRVCAWPARQLDLSMESPGMISPSSATRPAAAVVCLCWPARCGMVVHGRAQWSRSGRRPCMSAKPRLFLTAHIRGSVAPHRRRPRNSSRIGDASGGNAHQRPSAERSDSPSSRAPALVHVLQDAS